MDLKSSSSSKASSSDLKDFKIESPFPEIFLVPEFISKNEETYLSKKIDEIGNSNVIVKQDGTLSCRVGGWQKVISRRSMQWGGSLSSKGKLLPQQLPNFINKDWPNVFKKLRDCFNDINLFGSDKVELDNDENDERNDDDDFLEPNHCLVNEYSPGDGIAPHQDGPAYFPTVATISLDSHTIYDFYCYSDDYINLSNKLLEFNNTKRETSNDNGSEEKENLIIPTFSIQEASSSPTTTNPMAIPEKNNRSEDGQERISLNDSNIGRTVSSDPLFSILVPARSLIVIRSNCYKDLLHSIPNRFEDNLKDHLRPCLNFSKDLLDRISSNLVNEDFNNEGNDLSLKRGRRISLTFRRVEKVIKALNKFGK